MFLDEALIGDVSIYAILFWIRGLKLFLMFLYAKHQLFDWFTTPKYDRVMMIRWTHLEFSDVWDLKAYIIYLFIYVFV